MDSAGGERERLLYGLPGKIKIPQESRETRLDQNSRAHHILLTVTPLVKLLISLRGTGFIFYMTFYVRGKHMHFTLHTFMGVYLENWHALHRTLHGTTLTATSERTPRRISYMSTRELQQQREGRSGSTWLYVPENMQFTGLRAAVVLYLLSSSEPHRHCIMNLTLVFTDAWSLPDPHQSCPANYQICTCSGSVYVSIRFNLCFGSDSSCDPNRLNWCCSGSPYDSVRFSLFSLF